MAERGNWPAKARWNADRIAFGEIVHESGVTAEAIHFDGIHKAHAPTDKFNGGPCAECGEPWPCPDQTRAREFLEGNR